MRINGTERNGGEAIVGNAQKNFLPRVLTYKTVRFVSVLKFMCKTQKKWQLLRVQKNPIGLN